FGSNREAGVRLNASAARLENGVRNTTGNGEFASAGLDWRVFKPLTLQGDVEFYAKNVPEQGGVNLLTAQPPNNVIPITPVPNPRNLLSGTWAELHAKTTNFQIRADYAFLDELKLVGEFGRSYSDRSRYSVRISKYNIDTGENGTVHVNKVKQGYVNY